MNLDALLGSLEQDFRRMQDSTSGAFSFDSRNMLSPSLPSQFSLLIVRLTSQGSLGHLWRFPIHQAGPLHATH